MTREQIFKGMKVSITGFFENYERSEVIKIIEEMGGTVENHVSKNTDLLLVGERPGTKLLKAQKLGISIADEKDFEEMVNFKSSSIIKKNQQNAS